MEKLENSIYVILLNTLYRKKLNLNLYSKLVLNIKSKYLQNILNEYLDKACNSDLDVVSIILDGPLTNSKLAREFLELLNDKDDKPIPE